MKKVFTIFMLITAFLSCFGSNTSFNELCMYLYAVNPEYKGPDPDNRNKGRRTPFAPLSCVISHERGVEFLTIEKPEISYYEIEDEDGNVYNYGDEPSFIDALFSMSGEVSIMMVSESCDYIGYVEL